MPFSIPNQPTTTDVLLPIPLNPAAPLNDSQPSANPLINAGIGGGFTAAINTGVGIAAEPSLSIYAGGIGVLIQWIKNRSWFREETWTVPVLVVLCFVVALLVWWVIRGNMEEAIRNGFGILLNAHTNYEVGSKVSGVGLFKPTDPSKKWSG